jgi:RimJ/RimL family protein N-acetyltransferase
LHPNSDVQRNAFTATMPQFRGRGFALAAKIATMRWAAANGITRVSTANDDTNAPMLAINARLGYEPLGRLLTMRREL